MIVKNNQQTLVIRNTLTPTIRVVNKPKPIVKLISSGPRGPAGAMGPAGPAGAADIPPILDGGFF